MKFFPRACLAALAMLVLSAGAATAFPAIVKVALNLRAGPGIEYPIIRTMPGGSVVDVGECYDGWCETEWSGYEGYASASYLEFAGYSPGYVEPSPYAVLPRYHDLYPRIYIEKRHHKRKHYKRHHKRKYLKKHKRKRRAIKRHHKRRDIKRHKKRRDVRKHKRKRRAIKRHHKRKSIKRHKRKRRAHKRRGGHRKSRSHRSRRSKIRARSN